MTNLVVDSSVIFASLIKGRESRTLRRIIVFSEKLKFVCPEGALFEFKEYKEKFKSEEFEELVFIIFTKINIIPREFYREFMSIANKIAKEFDPKDTPFIALALKLNAPIWTNDKKMIIHGLKSGKYLALDTKAVEELLEGKSLEDVREGLKGRFS